MFGVLEAITLRIPPSKVKSNYVFVHLSSCIINYKKLRKKPSHILQKISLKLTNAHWQYGKGKKVVGQSPLSLLPKITYVLVISLHRLFFCPH